MIERDNALDRVRHLEQSTTILAQQLSSVTANANDKETRIAKANEVAAGAISLLDMATRSKDELVVERDALAARLASKLSPSRASAPASAPSPTYPKRPANHPTPACA